MSRFFPSRRRAALITALLSSCTHAQLFNLPALPGTPGSAITTSLNDSYAVADWIAATLGDQTPDSAPSFNLAPGYYRFTVQSYCLHAGTYAPDRGEGYPLAPLKGDKAALVRAILQRSVQHPEIEQPAIQQLLWGIEAGARFTDFQPAFQAKVAPLLTPAEMAGMTLTVGGALNLFAPQALKDALATYDQMRRHVTSAQATFAEMERVAVLTGAAPAGPGSRDLPAGVWTAAGNGFYARAMPTSYAETVLEIYRPAPYQLTRDAQGRITRLQVGGTLIEATYDDGPGRTTLTAGPVSVPIWRFASLRFTGLQPGQAQTVTGQGFVVPRGVTLSALPPDAGSDDLWTTYLNQAATAAEAQGRTGALQRYRQAAHPGSPPAGTGATDDLTDLRQFQAGVEAALQGDDHSVALVNRVRLAWEYASCVLAGDCSPAGDPAATDWAAFDPSQFVATPANTARQRLGLSQRLR